MSVDETSLEVFGGMQEVGEGNPVWGLIESCELEVPVRTCTHVRGMLPYPTAFFPSKWEKYIESILYNHLEQSFKEFLWLREMFEL